MEITKRVLVFGIGLLLVAIIGKFCEIKCRSKQKGYSIPVIQTREAKTFCRIKQIKVTGYCPCKKCCGKWADGKTSTGKDAWRTVGVAADPKLLPYGTRLVIPGIGIRKVDDTGGAMRQSAKKGIYHIDVRFHSHEAAKRFGVKWLNLKILN